MVKSIRDRIYSVSFEQGKGRLGELEADFKASLASEGKAFLLKTSFNSLGCRVPTSSQPFLPGASRIRAASNPWSDWDDCGHEIDSRDYKATKLNIDIPMKKFAITGMNSKIDFDRLRNLFTSRFEVPGEYEAIETLTRESGPLSEMGAVMISLHSCPKRFVPRRTEAFITMAQSVYCICAAR